MSGGIPGRIRMAMAYYQPLIGVPGVEFKFHRTTLYNSIYRFDDQIFVNQHTYGTYGHLAPILHLREMEEGNLFATYSRSAKMIWDEAYPTPASAPRRTERTHFVQRPTERVSTLQTRQDDVGVGATAELR